jgi:hypothetical protein
MAALRHVFENAPAYVLERDARQDAREVHTEYVADRPVAGERAGIGLPI